MFYSRINLNYMIHTGTTDTYTLPNWTNQHSSMWRLFVFQDYPYAGTQFGKHCFCGTCYDTLGTSTDCTMTCSGDSQQICGGIMANLVYQTSKDVMGQRIVFQSLKGVGYFLAKLVIHSVIGKTLWNDNYHVFSCQQRYGRFIDSLSASYG